MCSIFQPTDISQERIDSLCDAGLYNNAIKGYLIAAAKTANLPSSKIVDLLQALNLCFDDFSKVDAEKIFKDFCNTPVHFILDNKKSIDWFLLNFYLTNIINWCIIKLCNRNFGASHALKLFSLHGWTVLWILLCSSVILFRVVIV